jgi:hypothetical protein
MANSMPALPRAGTNFSQHQQGFSTVAGGALTSPAVLAMTLQGLRTAPLLLEPSTGATFLPDNKKRAPEYLPARVDDLTDRFAYCGVNRF